MKVQHKEERERERETGKGGRAKGDHDAGIPDLVEGAKAAIHFKLLNICVKLHHPSPRECRRGEG